MASVLELATSNSSDKLSSSATAKCSTSALDNIVGSLWQARQESSSSSCDSNQSPKRMDDVVVAHHDEGHLENDSTKHGSIETPTDTGLAGSIDRNNDDILRASTPNDDNGNDDSPQSTSVSTHNTNLDHHLSSNNIFDANNHAASVSSLQSRMLQEMLGNAAARRSNESSALLSAQHSTSSTTQNSMSSFLEDVINHQLNQHQNSTKNLQNPLNMGGATTSSNPSAPWDTFQRDLLLQAAAVNGLLHDQSSTSKQTSLSGMGGNNNNILPALVTPDDSGGSSRPHSPSSSGGGGPINSPSATGNNLFGGGSQSREQQAQQNYVHSNYEEQFKQLYDIDDNPQRKIFLDDLFTFMHKRGTSINRLPIMAKQVLDLYELYNLVLARGGLVEVINKKLWQEIIKGLGLPSSITSAAFTLRTQYTKYLYPLECRNKNINSVEDLLNAVDCNKRDSRKISLPVNCPALAASGTTPLEHLNPLFMGANPVGVNPTSISNATSAIQQQISPLDLAAVSPSIDPSFKPRFNVTPTNLSENGVLNLPQMPTPNQVNGSKAAPTPSNVRPQSPMSTFKQAEAELANAIAQSSPSSSAEAATCGRFNLQSNDILSMNHASNQQQQLAALEMTRLALWKMYNPLSVGATQPDFASLFAAAALNGAAASATSSTETGLDHLTQAITAQQQQHASSLPGVINFLNGGGGEKALDLKKQDETPINFSNGLESQPTGRDDGNSLKRTLDKAFADHVTSPPTKTSKCLPTNNTENIVLGQCQIETNNVKSEEVENCKESNEHKDDDDQEASSSSVTVSMEINGVTYKGVLMARMVTTKQVNDTHQQSHQNSIHPSQNGQTESASVVTPFNNNNNNVQQHIKSN